MSKQIQQATDDRLPLHTLATLRQVVRVLQQPKRYSRLQRARLARAVGLVVRALEGETKPAERRTP